MILQASEVSCRLPVNSLLMWKANRCSLCLFTRAPKFEIANMKLHNANCCSFGQICDETLGNQKLRSVEYHFWYQKKAKNRSFWPKNTKNDFKTAF